MIVLIGFAILAGAGTALSPCVLPVLPALLSAGGVGGRRRPLGIVLGLSITFTVTIVGVAKLVDGVGLGSDPLRVVAVVVLLAFGAALFVPDISARIEAPLSRLARFGPRSTGDGFLSGLLVGAALGFVYTPCASPILAAVISVSSRPSLSIRRHRYLRVTPDDLVEMGSLDLALREFFRAAMLAKRSLIICGGVGAGEGAVGLSEGL